MRQWSQRSGTETRSSVRDGSWKYVRIDTGLTLRFLHQALTARGCRSVRTCALLDKPSRRVEAVTVDYTGFVVEDLFLVGYGLDHDERWRNLPFVGVVEPAPTT